MHSLNPCPSGPSDAIAIGIAVISRSILKLLGIIRRFRIGLNPNGRGIPILMRRNETKRNLTFRSNALIMIIRIS